MMIRNSAIPDYTALFMDPGNIDPDRLSKSEWMSTARQAQTKVKSVSMLWTEVISYQLVWCQAGQPVQPGQSSPAIPKVVMGRAQVPEDLPQDKVIIFGYLQDYQDSSE